MRSWIRLLDGVWVYSSSVYQLITHQALIIRFMLTRRNSVESLVGRTTYGSFAFTVFTGRSPKDILTNVNIVTCV